MFEFVSYFLFDKNTHYCLIIPEDQKDIQQICDEQTYLQAADMILIYKIFCLLVFRHLSFARIPGNEHNLVVSSLKDGAANSTSCLALATNCTLRSAWEACAALPRTELCNIHLPINSTIRLTEEPLLLSAGQKVQIWGNDATIQSLFPFRAAKQELISTHVNVLNSNKDYAERCVQACSGDILSFALTCVGEPDDYTAALILGDNEIQYNLFPCTTEILYEFDGESCVNSLCYVMACYADSCAATINIIREIMPPKNISTPQFLQYGYNRSSVITPGIVPQLSISNLTLAGFGGPHTDGGAIYLNGPAAVTFDNVVFHQNTGRRGAAVWVANNEQGVAFDRCQFLDCFSYEGGAVNLYKGTADVNISLSEFVSCASWLGGGGLVIGTGNADISVDTTKFVGCSTGGKGGAVEIIAANSHLDFTFVTVDDCTSGDGAISLAQSNSRVSVRDSLFTHNYARGNGGGIYLGNENNEFLLVDTDFTNCRAALYGGGVFAGAYNHRLIVNGSQFSSCFAGEAGGGLGLFSHNTVSVFDSLFVLCEGSYFGGGIFANNANYGLIMDSVNVYECKSFYGGGMALRARNWNAQIRGSIFRGCSADTGGGVYLENKNDHLLIKETHFVLCSAFWDGAGMFSQTSSGLHLQQVIFSNNSADSCGGGLNLKAQNDRVTVFNCSFQFNRAILFGGAVYSQVGTNTLTIVSTLLDHNIAGNGGGALAVEGDNRNLLITDAETAAHSLVVESAHPYTGDTNSFYDGNDAIFLHQVDDPTAAAFLISFDPLTELSDEEYILIYGSFHMAEEETILFQFDRYDSLPGVDVPALRAPANFTIVMGTYLFVSLPDTTHADNLYGFKMYLTAVPLDPSFPTVFSNNHAGKYGGAVFMFSSVKFATITNTRFEGNTASSGGAVYLRSEINDFYMENNLFADNRASVDGGALVVSSACHTMYLRDCEFFRNIAVQNGGAFSLGTSNGLSSSYIHINIVDHQFDSDYIIFDSCLFSANSANFGGAIHMDKENYLSLVSCTVKDNVARVSGGGLLSVARNTVFILLSNFSSNIAADDGGGIAGLISNRLTLSKVVIDDNTAGIIYCVYRSIFLYFC